MSDFQLTGTLQYVGETKQVSEKFSKREFVIEVTEGKYPQTVAFQLSKERTDLIEPYGVGQDVTVFFNINGRAWDDPKTNERRYFNTLEAWRIKPVTTETATPPPAPKPASAPPPARPMPVEALGANTEDNLPF